jgi:TPP-dependent 2-oxoacid decarboxylase
MIQHAGNISVAVIAGYAERVPVARIAGLAMRVMNATKSETVMIMSKSDFNGFHSSFNAYCDWCDKNPGLKMSWGDWWDGLK